MVDWKEVHNLDDHPLHFDRKEREYSILQNLAAHKIGSLCRQNGFNFLSKLFCILHDMKPFTINYFINISRENKMDETYEMRDQSAINFLNDDDYDTTFGGLDPHIAGIDTAGQDAASGINIDRPRHRILETAYKSFYKGLEEKNPYKKVIRADISSFIIDVDGRIS